MAFAVAAAAVTTAWGASAGHGCYFAAQGHHSDQAASYSYRRQEGHSCPIGKDSAWQRRSLSFQHWPASGTRGRLLHSVHPRKDYPLHHRLMGFVIGSSRLNNSYVILYFSSPRLRNNSIKPNDHNNLKF